MSDNRTYVSNSSDNGDKVICLLQILIKLIDNGMTEKEAVDFMKRNVEIFHEMAYDFDSYPIYEHLRNKQES